jgi:peptide/nickel transport system permease protein
VLATALGTLVGAVVGTVSAFLGGRSDEAIMRTVDAIMSIPSLLLALLIVNLLGKSSLNALFAIALAFAPGMARVTRSVALSVRKQDYVNAAIARGESAAFIVGREMLPNVIAPIIVEMTIRVAFAVMLFATLSFLGLGAQPPASEWGLMVSEARRFMHLSPWMILWPSLAVALVAIGFNLLGDGLRDVLEPEELSDGRTDPRHRPATSLEKLSTAERPGHPRAQMASTLAIASRRGPSAWSANPAPARPRSRR